MCTAILRVLRIIASIPKAAPVVTVARTIIIPAWGISRSIAMVMAAAIRMSMQQSIMMNAAVAMSIMLRAQLGTLRMRMVTVAVDTSTIITGMRSIMTMNAAAVTSIIIMSMKSMMTMNAAVGTSIIMSMKSMSTMSVAAVMSIIMSTHIMFRGIPMTANVKFAILTRSTAMFVAKA